VLAAGRGERMRPLTDATPKPLLPVRGRPMIEWHLQALARDGVREVLINTAWLEEQFPAALGDGSRYGLSIRWSHEGRDWGGALETAGGIATALDWLSDGGREAFWVVSGDIWAPDFRFDATLAERFIVSGLDGHLWLVPNPPYHPAGDFGLGAPRPDLGPQAALGVSSRSASDGTGGACLTYANLALLRPGLLRHLAPGRRAALGGLLHEAMQAGRISVQTGTGRWANVGTPAQLAELQGDAGDAGL
jgi:MurNAc alpha-1-phosphate uridylyltransferase